MNSEYVKIIEKGKHLPTIISFSSAGTQKGYFSPYKIIESAGTNVIFINDTGDRWYQNGIENISNDTKQAVVTLVNKAKEIGNGKVVTFGTSMGGYGALLYAALGNVDGCMAFGIEAKLKLKASRSEGRMHKGIQVLYPDLKEVLSGTSFPIILFSSECDESDLLSAYYLKDLPNITNLTIRGMQHPGTQVFAMDNTFIDIIKSFVENLTVPVDFERKGHFMDNPDSITGLYEAYVLKKERKNDELWLSKLEEFNEKYPNNALVLHRLGIARLINQDRMGAEEVWRKSISIDPYQFEAYTTLGSLLRGKKEVDEAEHCFKRAIELNPYHASAYHQLGLISKLKRDFINTEYYFRKALELNKGSKDFKQCLVDFLLEDIERKTDEANQLISAT